MTNSFDDFIDDLMGNDLEAVAAAPTKASNAQTFPCGQCAGTGRWAGGTNRHGNSKCIACKGKGSFKTDPRKLKAQAVQRKASKAQLKQAALDAFQEQHPDMFAELRTANDYREGNTFIVSIAMQLFERGTLSEGQISAWYRGKEKLAAIKAERATAEAKAPTVDLDPIKVMFDNAVASGYKRPTYRAEGLTLSRAPDHGNNPGALYVKDADSGDYLGKILRGKYSGRPGITDSLLAIAADPKGAAVRYGQRTGTCSCCGRKLTNHASIDAGIGPICAERWGL